MHCSVPFTFVMAIGILLVGVITGTTTSDLNPILRQRWGFALHDFWDGTWYSLGTEVLFTTDPLMLYGTLLFVWFSLGVYEWQTSTKQTMILYWLTDTSVSLVLSVGLILPLYWAGTRLGLKLAYADDVGMSGGGFGCVGAWVHCLAPTHQKWIFGIILSYLLTHLIFFTSLFDDSLHLLSYLVGFYLDGRLNKKSVARPQK